MAELKQLPEAFCEKVRQLAFELEQAFGRPLAIVVAVKDHDTFAMGCFSEEAQEATLGRAIEEMGNNNGSIEDMQEKK